MQTNFLKRHILLFVLGLLFLQFCSRDGGQIAQLNQAIRSALEDDAGINAQECADLQAIIAQDDQLQSRFSSAEKLTNFIDEAAQKMAKGRRTSISYPIQIACGDGTGTTNEASAAQPGFNFYIENSGSMYGYLGDNTAFDDVVLGLMTNINRYDENIDMAFVNDKIHPVDAQLAEFMDYLNPGRMRSIGNTRSSNLADVLEMVIEQQAEDDKAAILLSDFIFSISNHQNVRSELTDQKYGITNIIHDNRLKERGLGILVMQFYTQFKGNYFTFDNKTIRLDEQRPYYIWVIGKVDLLKGFLNKYDVKGLKNFSDAYVLYSAEDVQTPYYGILKSTDAKGRFNLVNRGGDQPIRAIKDIQYGARGAQSFQFAVAFDASALPLEEDYLMDAANYQVSSNMEDLFEVIEVKKVSSRNVSPNDRGYQGSATHYVVLQTNEMVPGKQEIMVKLLKQLPAWIKDSSTDDDRSIGADTPELDKTFGFLDLIEGAAGDFKPKGSQQDTYFSLNLELTR
ncbi:MAG: hypothetical protein AAF705_03240 [Bacteroidota bacterium]